MVHLPAPPRFTLPPPPMPPSDLFDASFLSQLTCSSIRQQQSPQQQNFQANSRLILISSGTFLVIAILLSVLVLVIQYYRQRRSLLQSLKKQPLASVGTMSSESSVSNSRSYETISSRHTGVYLESIDTSATTYSTEPSRIVCLHCQHDHSVATATAVHPPPYYHTLDILPS